MSDTSHVLGLPFIQPAQAQKHVTHNEAIRALDALVQLNVTDRDRTVPPASPVSGDRHIVADGAGGAWADKDGDIAVFEDAGWTFYLQNLPNLGINTTANDINRLAVSADATLLSHEGGDHRVVVNKADDSDTASLLFQSNWTGHAEMGLTGGQDFALRVSPDGSSFTNALQADAATGVVTAPQGINFGASNLSSYEEGTFTPRLTFDDDDTGIIYDQQLGYFTRVGNLVLLQIAIDLSAMGTSSGIADIQDLPFDASPLYHPGELFFVGGGAGLTVPKCRTRPGRKIRLQNAGQTGMNNLTDANFTDSANFKITLLHTV